MFAKYIHGYLETAKGIRAADDAVAAGYKPVQFTEMPGAPSGYHYESGWKEQDDAIVQVWTLTPLPDDIDEAEAYDIIFGGAE